MAEYVEGLPKDWKGLNEEIGFGKEDSTIITFRNLEKLLTQSSGEKSRLA